MAGSESAFLEELQAGIELAAGEMAGHWRDAAELVRMLADADGGEVFLAELAADDGRRFLEELEQERHQSETFLAELAAAGRLAQQELELALLQAGDSLARLQEELAAADVRLLL